MAIDRIDYPTEPAYPAFQIPLTDEELKTLGELCAIQGQLEFLMMLTVKVLRKKSLQGARKLMCSPNMSANAKVYREAVEKSAARDVIKGLARAIESEIGVVRQGRNDFVHAVFATAEGGEGDFSMQRNKSMTEPPKSERPAVAVHHFKTKPMQNLHETRNKAAALSQFVLHIYDDLVSSPQGPGWHKAE